MYIYEIIVDAPACVMRMDGVTERDKVAGNARGAATRRTDSGQGALLK